MAASVKAKIHNPLYLRTDYLLVRRSLNIWWVYESLLVVKINSTLEHQALYIALPKRIKEKNPENFDEF